MGVHVVTGRTAATPTRIEHAPYDRIMVTAAPDEVPPALVAQTLATRPVRFVPMTGGAGD